MLHLKHYIIIIIIITRIRIINYLEIVVVGPSRGNTF